jgi:hypothetical protein
MIYNHKPLCIISWHMTTIIVINTIMENIQPIFVLNIKSSSNVSIYNIMFKRLIGCYKIAFQDFLI